MARSSVANKKTNGYAMKYVVHGFAIPSHPERSKQKKPFILLPRDLSRHRLFHPG
jgi:hypothetical protein